MEATGGGTKKHLELLACHLDPDAFDITVACPSARHPSYGDESVLPALRAAGVCVRVIEMRRSVSPASDFTSIARLWSLIREQQFDIVHTHSSKAGILGRVAARLCVADGAPVVIHTAHGFYFLGEQGFKRAFYQVVERLGGRLTDRLIAVSESERAAAVEHGIVPPERVTVIPNGIVPPTRGASCPDRRLGASLGVNSDRPVVGTVSRFVPQKDPDTLLEAVARLAQAAPEAQFLWCGDGPLRAATESRAKTLGIADKIVFAGYRHDVAAILPLLDVFVIAPLFEGLPYTLLEAMAAGRPVVSTDVVGVRDVLEHGVTGVLVPTRNPDAIARAVLRLVQSPQTAQAMGEAGRALIAERFRLDTMIAETARVYREAYAGRSTPA